MNRSKKIIIAGVIIVVVGLIGYALTNLVGGLKNKKNGSDIWSGAGVSRNYSKELFDLEKRLDNTASVEEVEVGKRLSNENSGKVISEIESEVRKIAKNELSPAEDAQSKLLLSRILLYRVSGSDSPARGIELLKEVAKSDNYPSLWRALAFQRLSDTIKDVVDDQYLKIITDDAYFKSMRDESYPQGGTVKNLCQASFDLYPLPLCSYRIANFYLYRLLDDKMLHNLDDQQRKDYLKNAKEKIDMAEKVMSNYPLEYQNIFDRGKGIFWKPFIRTKLYLLGEIDSKDFMIQGDNNFVESISIFNSGKVWPTPEAFFTYFYAVSIAEVYREEKIDKVKELTDEVVQRYKRYPKIPFFLYTRKLADSKYNNTYDVMQFILLSHMNPNFRNLLVELGWSEERLNTPFPKLP
jgi:hypothetical protein